ncbi:MAG: thioredoxin domain-containing protein [Myxococcales bacterium]|nr:thioredoxin domain-containing protein [Myxococcales bacterium]
MSRRNTIVVAVFAATIGFIAGQLSSGLNWRPFMPGSGEVALGELAPFQTDNPGEPAEESEIIPIGDSPMIGPAQAPVTVITFTDFECPYCSRATGTLEMILDEYGDDVRVVHKNLPLSFHEHAMPAARAALAAREQGKFWEYHDLLFANRTALTREDLISYAQQLELNVDEFTEALDSDRFDAEIAADTRLAATLGFRGTPSFVINGRQLVGARPFSEFQRVIDSELEEIREMEGVTGSAVFARRVEINQEPAEAAPPAPTPVVPVVEEARPTPEPSVRTSSNSVTATRPVSMQVFADLSASSNLVMGDYVLRLREAFPTLDVRVIPQVTGRSEEQRLIGAAFAMADRDQENALLRGLLEADTLDSESIARVAESPGLDVTVLQQQAGAEDLADRYADLAGESGVVSVPALILDGQRLVGIIPYENLEEMVAALVVE